MVLRRVATVVGAALLTAGLLPGVPAQGAAARTVTIDAVGRSGEPSYADVSFVDPRTGRERRFFVSPHSPGSSRVSLPEQVHDVYASVYQANERNGDHTLFFRSLRVAAGNDRLSLDARRGKPVNVKVDEPTAEGLIEGFMSCLQCPYEFHTNVYTKVGRLFVVPARRRGLTFRQISTWTKAGSTPETPTPYGFHLESEHKGGLPDGVAQHVRKADLAAVPVTYRRAAGITRGWVTWGDMFRGGPGLGTELKLPATVTEYVMPGLSYTPELSVNGIKPAPGGYGPLLQMGSRKYVKGRARAETWNVAVSTPRVSSMLSDGGYADVFAMDPFAQTTGYYEWERPKGSLTVRQGSRVLGRTTKFGEFGFRISGARKRHRLTMNVQRLGTGILLSDRATVDWWFTPGRSRVGKPLSLMAIHVNGQGLDQSNTAKAGSTIEFPVVVRRQPGAPTAKITKVVAEVSFDRGRTWRRVALRNDAGKWIATIRHPATPGPVSLRTSAWDATGDSVRQTIHRAYTISS